jgi:ATP-dependent Clp protease adaptor protein ClpS
VVRAGISIASHGVGALHLLILTGTIFRVLTLLDKCWSIFYFPGMVETSTPEIMPDIEREEKSDPKSDLEPGYLVVCWNDPVNFMEYVTHVFQKVFGWNKQKAEHHMMEVHNQGKSILVRESMEKAEHYVHMLQKYSLHATMEKEE